MISKSVYGYYVCLLEIEQMIIQEETEFKSILYKLHDIYKNQVLCACSSVLGKEKISPLKLKFPPDMRALAALSLFIESAQNELELSQRDQTIQKMSLNHQDELSRHDQTIRDLNSAIYDLNSMVQAMKRTWTWRIGRIFVAVPGFIKRKIFKREQ